METERVYNFENLRRQDVRPEIPDEIGFLGPHGPVLEAMATVLHAAPEYGLNFRDLEREISHGINLILWQRRDYISEMIHALLDKVESVKPEMKEKVRFFFTHDVSAYMARMVAVYSESLKKNDDEEATQAEFDRVMIEICAKADVLDKSIANKMIGNEVKDMFRRIVGRWTYESELTKRGFEKPRGYPGDYLMLEAIYNNTPKSEGLGRYFDKAFLALSYAGPVTARKDKMRNIIERFLVRARQPALKVLNLACGSCRELRELLESDFSVSKAIEITCVDHDEESLDFSRKKLANSPDRITFNFVQGDILSMPKQKDYYAKLFGQQDMIYSLGLIDYVPDRILKRLIGFWFSLLGSKGRLVLTHKDIDKDLQAPLLTDWFCDWRFVSRNEPHLVKLVKAAIPLHHWLTIERDSSGKIIFLFVDKE
ncbi:MAG: class I SAM-dependent methyltransferase [Desulfobacterales bacterium]|nr:class I SAM-dependent methyltransferase [Desulfobacterales bacterium]